MYRKIEIKMKIIIMIKTMIIERPSAGIRASSVQQSISTDNHWQLLDLSALLHSTCTCVGIRFTPVSWLTFSKLCMITSFYFICKQVLAWHSIVT